MDRRTGPHKVGNNSTHREGSVGIAVTRALARQEFFNRLGRVFEASSLRDSFDNSDQKNRSKLR